MPTNRPQAPCRLAAGSRLVGNLGTLTMTLLLFYLGAQPFAVGLFPEPWDKLAHFVVFGTITSLFWLGTSGRRPLRVIAVVTLIGALDEWHQAGLPGRSMDLADLAIDLGAAISMLVLLHVFCRKAQ